MDENKLFSTFKGYGEALAQRDSLASKGSDFTEFAGSVTREINKLHPKRLNLIVAEIIEETATAKTIRLVSKDGYLPPFQAGQYVNLFLTVGGVNTARPYAISSSPQERRHYDLTVREIPGGFVSPYILNGITQGMEVTTTGPLGNFYHHPVFHGDDLVFVAGGSGVAPAMSMIRDIAERNLPFQFHLIYGSRVLDDIILRDALLRLEDDYDFLTVTHVISEPEEGFAGRTGFIDAEVIKELAAPFDGKMFYLCGPPAMNDFCLREMEQAGVPSRRIRVEANGPPVTPEKLEGWPTDVDPAKSVTVSIRGKGSFVTTAGEPLLNALERNGYSAENACRSGECSMCRVKVLSGDVFDPPQSKLRRSDRHFGWTHSCVAYPLEDIEILM